jgi:cysteinyl-tRNA synthetase
MGAEKMSKSLGNVITPAELLAQGHQGETLRLALLSAHYRQPLSWTGEVVAQAKTTLDRWYRAKAILLKKGELIAPADVLEALSNDLNTPLAISQITELAKRANQVRLAAEKAQQTGDTDQAEKLKHEAARYARQMLGGAQLLGVLSLPSSVWFRGEARIDKYVNEKIAAFAEAKRNHDFATADRVRDELEVDDIILEDGPSGITWRLAQDAVVHLSGVEATGMAGSVGTEVTLKGFTKSIEQLIRDRDAARGAKNFAEADRIRKELLDAGIVLEDKAGKTTWRRA